VKLLLQKNKISKIKHMISKLTVLKNLNFFKKCVIVKIQTNFRRIDMKNLKKMFILCSLALVFTAILAGASQAAGLMNVATSKAVSVFNSIKLIIFVVGGFGLVGIAWQAIWGKMKWTWFAGLAVGLAILAAASAIVNYATGDNMSAGSSGATVTDTFGSSATGDIQ
jgi:hypothetical protein